MKKFLINVSLLFMAFSAGAQTLTEDVIKMKKELKENLIQYKSAVKTSQDDAEKITVDISGWDMVSFYTWITEDGGGGDWGVWGDATLIANDGTREKVSEMSFEYASSSYMPYGLPKRDGNLVLQPIKINGKVYPSGVSVVGNGEFYMKLGGKYKSFEAEIGIDDWVSSGGSVMFMVQNLSAFTLVSDLVAKYPVEMNAMTNLGKINFEEWLLNDGSDMEKKAATNALDFLSDPTYYRSKVNAVSGSLDERITSYLAIVAEISRIVEVQNKLQFVNAANVRRAFEDMKTAANYDVAKYEAKLKELESLMSGTLNLYNGDKNEIAKAEKILALSREILISNKALDNDRVILSRYHLGATARSASAPQLGTQNNNWTNQMSSARMGFNAEIAEMTNIRAEKPEFKTIYKPKAPVAVTDLMLHWDADKILFTSVNDRGLWGVFQVGVDGNDVEEVIKVDDPDLEFTDGTFLPSGKFIANSNIGYQGVPCVNGTDVVGNMVLFDPETKNLRRLTFDQDANWHPLVGHNGKVMYVRWEYTDLTHYFSRIVMHMNPDGTEQKSLYGSGGFFPNSTFDIQPLPGNTSKFIGVISGHHGVARSGRLMIFDPAKSRDRIKGIVQELPFSKRPIIPEIKDRLVDGVWPQFLKPHPVTDKYFLVTAKLSPQSLWGVYLVDIYDNMTLVTEAEGEGYINATYVQKRPTPPVIPEKVDLNSKEATVYIQDIYEGEGLPGVPRGTVKKLRLFAYEYAYLDSPSNHMAQGIQSGWDIKRILGEVDVNHDGSVNFKVPANTPISIQPLDSLGQAMQWMRSWFTGMPGETVSCVGCHEDQNMLPMARANMASKQQPQALKPLEGGPRPFTFKLEIQPILDRACIACHNEDSKMDLTSRPDPGVEGHKFMHDFEKFTMGYLNLHPYVNRQGPEADALVMEPYEYHASTSELIRILKNGHHGVELTDQEWRKLYAWIDLNAPYHGAFIQKDFKGYEQISRRQQLANKYNNVHVDWTKEIQDYAKYLESKGEIVPVKPEYTEPTYKSASAKGWPISASSAKAMQDKLGETTKSIDLGNGVKMVFRKVPAGQFVMGSSKYGKESAPESKVKIDKAFWIGEMEVSNEQYNALVPEHDSRYMAEFWKDHTTPGHVANLPGQPVIRVSYNQVLDYCKKLSAQTGLNITLPTEAQWEWAARAGSATDSWFGDLGSDYGKCENLGDVTLEKMAFRGNKSNSLFRYFNYLPKDEKVNDENLFQIDGKSYNANVWGLYDMLGNVREWTRSDYIPYPYSANPKTKADLKVVRGGSWTDRAKFSTSYSRKSALPWQPQNNVGFRLVIEE